MQFNPLFLSGARRNVSSEQSPARRGRSFGVEAFASSIPSAASNTKHYRFDTVHQTDPKSNGQSDPTSNNLRPTRWRRHRVSEPGSIGAGLHPINDSDVQVYAVRGASTPWPRAATGTRFAASCRSASPLLSARFPAATNPSPVPAARLAVAKFRMVSCSLLSHQRAK